MKNKKAAMEMSIGTLVTIVLLVTVLILGVVLVQKIFFSARSLVDLTDQELRNEVNKLFSEDSRVVIYPGTNVVEIRQETTDGVGIGIRNLLTGVAGSTKFSYEVIATDFSDCRVSKDVAESWIITGKQESNIPIASGDMISDKILFRIPVGAPLCIAKYRVNVNAGNEIYATKSFNIEIRAK